MLEDHMLIAGNNVCVLAAVREDRMPGGRNSGAVYNLYKVQVERTSIYFESCIVHIDYRK